MKQERNIEGLRQNAQKKRQKAIERTEQGIKKLLSEGKSVNFKTVAETAEVSTAWLYKETQIKERIENLREQQSQKKKLPSSQQMISNESNKEIIMNLKKEIDKLEVENRKLRDHIEVIYKIALQFPDLNQQIKAVTNEIGDLENN